MALGFTSAFIAASFFEWLLHRYVMHRPLLKFDYAFRTHALTHHKIFKADETYHLQDPEDAHTIPMAWWNGPILIVIMLLPHIAAGWALGSPAIMWGALIANCAYYTIYETLHWCMHQPQNRRVERTGWFFRINGHHLLHHRYMRKNYNVVFPFADLCLGTMLLRAPMSFAQATGPSVPDVQPRRVTTESASPSRFSTVSDDSEEPALARD